MQASAIKKRGDGGGISLIEVLISMVLLGLILSVVYAAMVPSMKTWRKVNDDAETQQSAMIASDKVFRDLFLTNTYTITIISSPVSAISCLSENSPQYPATTSVTAGDQIDLNRETPPIKWKKYVIFYHDPAGQLLKRKEVPYPASSSLKRLTETALLKYISSSEYPVTVVARNIKAMYFKYAWFPNISVDITALLPTVGKARETRFYFEINPKN